MKITALFSWHNTFTIHYMHCYENHTTDVDMNVFMFNLSKFGLLIERRQRHVMTNMSSQFLTVDPQGPLSCPKVHGYCTEIHLWPPSRPLIF